MFDNDLYKIYNELKHYNELIMTMRSFDKKYYEYEVFLQEELKLTNTIYLAYKNGVINDKYDLTELTELIKDIRIKLDKYKELLNDIKTVDIPDYIKIRRYR